MQKRFEKEKLARINSYPLIILFIRFQSLFYPDQGDVVSWVYLTNTGCEEGIQWGIIPL